MAPKKAKGRKSPVKKVKGAQNVGQESNSSAVESLDEQFVEQQLAIDELQQKTDRIEGSLGKILHLLEGKKPEGSEGNHQQPKGSSSVAAGRESSRKRGRGSEGSRKPEVDAGRSSSGRRGQRGPSPWSRTGASDFERDDGTTSGPERGRGRSSRRTAGSCRRFHTSRSVSYSSTSSTRSSSHRHRLHKDREETMSALGIPLLVSLGFCLLIGGGAQAKEDMTIRPNLPPRCYKAPDTHMCGGRVAFRWYYDLFTDSCKVFPYRGCPNPNSFATRKDCINKCLRASVDVENQGPTPEKDAQYKNPEGKSAKVPTYRSSDSSDYYEGKVLNHPSGNGRQQRKNNEDNVYDFHGDEENSHILEDPGYAVPDRRNEHSHRAQHHSRRPRSYFPYEEHSPYHQYKNQQTHQNHNHNVQYAPKEKYMSSRYGRHPKHRDNAQTPRRYATYDPHLEGRRPRLISPHNSGSRKYTDHQNMREEHDHQIHYHHDRPEHQGDGREPYWDDHHARNDQYIDLELTGINYDERKHRVHNRDSYHRRERDHKPILYEDVAHHDDLYDNHEHHQTEHDMGGIEPRHAVDEDHGRDRHDYYHYEKPEHPARSPQDEYYYGRHDPRPEGTPPNMYIYGEGPVHPVEVPKELQEYDPDRDEKDIQPVSEEYDSPQDGRQQKKKPFLKESGYAPRPLTGHFPGIPTDAALRRFRLRSGWVIEIIPGGFRAVKDERHLNGWRHVYARIYREAPDGSAGRSIWMFQSEYEPPKDDHSPPPEYLQHVSNNNQQHHHQRQHHRRKRHVTLSRKSEHWFSSTSSYSFPSERSPVPWEGANSDDPHEEFYREPLSKSHFGEEPRRSPFTNSMNHNSNGQQRSPMEGRSLYPNMNFDTPRHPARDYNPKPEGHNNGFPPRDAKDMPHGNAYQRRDMGMFGRPQGRNENNVKPYYEMHRETRPQGRNEEEKISKEDLETPLNSMTDEEIFDKFRIAKKNPKGTQESQADQEPENSGVEEEAGSEDQSSEDHANLEGAPQCAQFPETGPCRAYIRRWYFDPRKAECFTFIYGGCEGNKNSFKTKEECMKTCTGPVKEEPEKPEIGKHLQPDGRYMGLRRQSRKQQPLPVMITTTISDQNPEVTSAPQLMPEAKKAETGEETSQENSSSGEDEEQEVDEEKVDHDKSEEEFNPRVINHYHTYHNYGPQHTNHGDFQPRSASSEDKSSSSEEEEEEEEEEKDEQQDEKRAQMKKNKKRKGNSKIPTPFNMFYKFLRRLGPGLSKNNLKKPDNMEVKSSRSKKGSITLVKFLITKKRRKQDNMNPFSSLLSSGMPRRSSPFTIFFSRPEPRQFSPFMPPQQHIPYNNGPDSNYHNGPPPFDRRPHYNNEPPHYNNGPHYDNRPPPYNNRPFLQGPNNYHQDPHPSDMSNPFSPTFLSPMDNLLSPITRLLFPWSPFNSRKPVVQRGEKNLGCSQSVNPGPCTDRPGFVRWYYDAQKGDCDIFYYTGCGGNNNRFETLKQCHDVCMVKTPAPPLASPRPRSKEGNTPEVNTNELPQEPQTERVEQIEPAPVDAEQTEPEKSQLEQAEPQVDEPEVLPEIEQPEQVLVVNTEPEASQEEPYVREEEVEEHREEKAKVTEKVEEEVEEKKMEKEEKEENEVVAKQHLVHSGPVVHTFEFANMHLDTRMEYVLVVVIMILGGAALIVLVAITAYFMYKKHKLATRGPKETPVQKVFHAHAYPEVHKISVIELPRELAGVHDLALK